MAHRLLSTVGKLLFSRIYMRAVLSCHISVLLMCERIIITYYIGLGGFGIRFTVQFNLFAGSILGTHHQHDFMPLFSF